MAAGTLPLLETVVARRRVSIVATQRDGGDVHPGHVDATTLAQRQVALTGRRWAMADEIHGVDVLDLDVLDLDRFEGSSTVGIGDVVVSRRGDVHMAIWTADCAPLFLIADDGTVVGVHAGWRGLAAGVVDVAIATARRDGAEVIAAVLGPVIGPCCDAFGQDDLAAVAAGTHTSPGAIRGLTHDGRAALDVTAAVRGSLTSQAIDLMAGDVCTGCDGRWFSHRVHGDTGRHATVAVIEQAEHSAVAAVS